MSNLTVKYDSLPLVVGIGFSAMMMLVVGLNHQVDVKASGYDVANTNGIKTVEVATSYSKPKTTKVNINAEALKATSVSAKKVVKATPAKVEDVKVKTNKTVAPKANIQQIVYTTQYGDTLNDIATRYNTTVSSIQALNNIVNSNIIRVGVTLKINQNSLSAEAVANPTVKRDMHVNKVVTGNKGLMVKVNPEILNEGTTVYVANYGETKTVAGEGEGITLGFETQADADAFTQTTVAVTNIN